MTGKNVRIAAANGGEFDCYVAAPASAEASAGKPASRAPAVIIVPSVFGVDPDVRKNCDELAVAGFLAIGHLGRGALLAGPFLSHRLPTLSGARRVSGTGGRPDVRRWNRPASRAGRSRGR